MKNRFLNRRNFSASLASFFALFGVADAAFASRRHSDGAKYVEGDALTHTAGAIHQEVVFNASRKRVYEALTEAKQFDGVVALSENGKSLKNRATEISHDAGGAFSLFGGYIVGRHIEMVPNERLVQAWRETSWPAAVYSIVKFELTEDGAGTKLIFDHTGFPGSGEHLFTGWRADYWEPLRKYLG